MQVFGVTTCVVCGRGFERLAPRSVCCGKDCRKKYHLQKMYLWHKEHRRHELQYRTNRRPRANMLRKHRRRSIYDIWGRDNDWHVAENKAEEILRSTEGYTDVMRLNYMPTCPFDIVADFYDTRTVFQVTTRTHTSKKLAHKLAKDLGLHHMVIFISPSAKLYIIKNFSTGGLAELNEREVKAASKYA